MRDRTHPTRVPPGSRISRSSRAEATGLEDSCLLCARRRSEPSHLAPFSRRWLGGGGWKPWMPDSVDKGVRSRSRGRGGCWCRCASCQWGLDRNVLTLLGQLLKSVVNRLRYQRALLHLAFRAARSAHSGKSPFTLRYLDPISVLHYASLAEDRGDMVAKDHLGCRDVGHLLRPAFFVRDNRGASEEERHQREWDQKPPCISPTQLPQGPRNHYSAGWIKILKRECR